MVEEQVENEENVESEQTTEEVSQEQLSGEWEPNYSYSVRNEDFEFDEWAKPFIKDKDSEEALRQLYTKSRGLDHVKSNLESTETELSSLRQRSDQLESEYSLNKQEYDNLKKLAKEDFPAFAQIVGLEDEKILNYANQRLDYKEAPDHVKQQMDRDSQMRSQAYQESSQADMLRKQNEKLIRERHELMFQKAFEPTEIQSFEKQFDQRMGDGAFKKHVRQFGSNQFRSTKTYVEPDMAVQQVYAQFKPLFTEKLDEINQKEKVKQKVPTNLGPGSAGSVVTKKVKSIKELRDMANKIAREEGYAYN